MRRMARRRSDFTETYSRRRRVSSKTSFLWKSCPARLAQVVWRQHLGSHATTNVILSEAKDLLSLPRIIQALRRQHGRVVPPPPRTAFEWVLWENCSYLAKREQRFAAFALLKKSVGLIPAAIVRAPQEKLVAGAMHGH